MLLPTTELRPPTESRHSTGRHARPEADPGETSWSAPDLPASPLLTWTSQPATTANPGQSDDRALSVDRALSLVDLSFPFTASLADSLHDELFTHRTITS
jgi:hypothetical protein